jgi:uncharacterized protein
MSTLSDVKPNYIELVKFLISPFLEDPNSLNVDCETYADQRRVLIRVAFSGTDKGRVFGRGGRTLQSIRAVVNASAQLVQQTVHVEVYGEREGRDSGQESRGHSGHSRGGQRPRSPMRSR